MLLKKTSPFKPNHIFSGVQESKWRRKRQVLSVCVCVCWSFQLTKESSTTHIWMTAGFPKTYVCPKIFADEHLTKVFSILNDALTNTSTTARIQTLKALVAKSHGLGQFLRLTWWKERISSYKCSLTTKAHSHSHICILGPLQRYLRIKNMSFMNSNPSR